MSTRIYNISITPALNGFVCQCGCQTLVFESVAKLVSELQQYLTNPTDTEARYRKEAINARYTTGPMVAEPPSYATTGTERAQQLTPIGQAMLAGGAVPPTNR